MDGGARERGEEGGGPRGRGAHKEHKEQAGEGRELRNGGNGARTPAAEAERNGMMAAIAGIPASIPWPGMKRTARRISWWRWRGTGWSEARASSTAAAADVGLNRGRFRVRVSEEGEQGGVREGRERQGSGSSLSTQGKGGPGGTQHGHGGMARQCWPCRHSEGERNFAITPWQILNICKKVQQQI